MSSGSDYISKGTSLMSGIISLEEHAELLHHRGTHASSMTRMMGETSIFTFLAFFGLLTLKGDLGILNLAP